ncbi:MAG: tetraacyldisaccharide 4'-kinase [Nitrospirae bacterium]|nr:tetraacyldisaccharide 4'-kinase [Candidatus Manganitrophaceae bacterium]
MATHNQKSLLARLWEDNSGKPHFLHFPLKLLSWVYAFVMRLRLWLYQKEWLAQKRVPCHVVSIGNITTGGTGKTPMTLYLAEEWQKRGYKVGIVSRGYRRKNKVPLVLVTDGTQIFASPSDVGDEPYLMAQRLSGVPIVVCADRFEGCQALIHRFAVEVILLDDAFQHLKMYRDQNILIIDATKPFGNGHLLPRGPLREPLSAIKRSDLLIFSRVENETAMHAMMQRITPYQSQILQSCFETIGIIDLKTDDFFAPEVLKGKSVLPFCGIGNPDAFLAQLRRLGANLASAHIFEDHHDYKKSDLEKIINSVNENNNIWIVTTEKDAVKIKPLMTETTKIYALRIGPVFKKGSENILERLFIK